MKQVMKQPELGHKISQLRKSKGWTQEELVEKCNISVRTIQRIEAGEVTPRSYTIRTLLEALDYELEEVIIEENSLEEPERKALSSLLLWTVIAGIVYFFSEFYNVYVDFLRYDEGIVELSPIPYLILKGIVLATFSLFMWGFVIIARLINNFLLKISSFFQIGMLSLVVFIDLFTYFNPSFEYEGMIVGLTAMQGFVLFFFGMALYRSSVSLGDIARYSGLLVMLSGFCYFTFVLALIGLVLMIPTELMQIIILIKTMDELKKANGLKRMNQTG